MIFNRFDGDRRIGYRREIFVNRGDVPGDERFEPEGASGFDEENVPSLAAIGDECEWPFRLNRFG